MNTAQQLHEAGQSIWYDNIQRGLLENGELAGMIDRGEIRGVTSNPTIFMNAITKSHDYDAGLVPLALAGRGAEEIFWELAIEDIQAAADLFRPMYDESERQATATSAWRSARSSRRTRSARWPPQSGSGSAWAGRT